jgi:hypothetical protein
MDMRRRYSPIAGLGEPHQEQDRPQHEPDEKGHDNHQQTPIGRRGGVT